MKPQVEDYTKESTQASNLKVILVDAIEASIDETISVRAIISALTSLTADLFIGIGVNREQALKSFAKTYDWMLSRRTDGTDID